MMDPFPYNVVLVSGSRDLTWNRHISTIDHWLTRSNPDIVIQGGARGADKIAKGWADLHGVHHATVPAMWDHFNKGAGPKRNIAMTYLRPTILLAFPTKDSIGTRHMIKEAMKLDDIEIHVIEM